MIYRDVFISYLVVLLLFTLHERLQMCSVHYVSITFVPVIHKYEQVAINIVQIQKLSVVLVMGIMLHLNYIDFYRF